MDAEDGFRLVVNHRNFDRLNQCASKRREIVATQTADRDQGSTDRAI